MDYADVPGMDLTSRLYLKAQKTVKDGEEAAARPSNKKARMDETGKHSFPDSESIIQGSCLLCIP